MLRLKVFVLALFFTNSIFAQSKRTSLPVTDPTTKGHATSFFHDIGKEATDSVPSLGSFLVWRGGGLLYEGYFHGASASTSFNIKSVTKSMVSAMAGIAKDKGLLPDLDKPVLHFFPEFSKPLSKVPGVWFADTKAIYEETRQKLTLKHLLTMQPGFLWSDFGPLATAFINSSDPVRFMLDLPFDQEPGTQFIYCSGATSVFSAALAKAVKTDLKQFANTYLFLPAGMVLQRWDKDPVGRYLGASEMYMNAQSLMRFGLLYLHKGKVNGKQVISESWIRESTDQHATLDFWDIMPGANGYGYFWWRRKTNGHQAYIASGYGGQLICVVPDLDMVIVATCFLNDQNRGRADIKMLHTFIDKVTKTND